LDGTPYGWTAGSTCGCDCNYKSNLLANINTVALSISPTHYNPDVYGVWAQCFQILGSSPFGAGGYSGSISVFFLCTVLGVAAANLSIKDKIGKPLSLDYYFYSQFCDAQTGFYGQGCALCSYCYPAKTGFDPANYLLPGNKSMLEGLDSYPMCSYDHCTTVCAQKKTDVETAVEKFSGMDFGTLYKKLLLPGLECYVASDRTLGALID
jgi:hypothetical protein